MRISVALWICIGVPLVILFLGGMVLLALKLGIIVTKAVEEPEQGESTSYRLEQGQEVDRK